MWTGRARILNAGHRCLPLVQSDSQSCGLSTTSVKEKQKNHRRLPGTRAADSAYQIFWKTGLSPPRWKWRRWFHLYTRRNRAAVSRKIVFFAKNVALQGSFKVSCRSQTKDGWWRILISTSIPNQISALFWRHSDPQQHRAPSNHYVPLSLF